MNSNQSVSPLSDLFRCASVERGEAQNHKDLEELCKVQH